MAELKLIGSNDPPFGSLPDSNARVWRQIVWLQAFTVAWMLFECGISVYSAITAHSPVMMAFGSDSVIELLSALLVVLQRIPRFPLTERNVSRMASLLLFFLAFSVVGIALTSLILGLHPSSSRAGIAITSAALVVMPVFAWLKRRKAQQVGNAALAADAVQSATCAYLALIALVGLAVNSAFHLFWLDAVGALVAVPFLVREARSLWQGHRCSCC